MEEETEKQPRKSTLKLEPGKFYRSIASDLWCCFRVEPERAKGAKCVHVPTGRSECFYLDGRYDKAGTYLHTLLEEVDTAPPKEAPVSGEGVPAERHIAGLCRQMLDLLYDDAGGPMRELMKVDRARELVRALTVKLADGTFTRQEGKDLLKDAKAASNYLNALDVVLETPSTHAGARLTGMRLYDTIVAIEARLRG
jgi:hypothetical protein